MGDRAAAVAAGIGYVPADRSADGLFPGHDALRNASASILDRSDKIRPARVETPNRFALPP